MEGKELEFYKWEGDVPELLKDVRDKLNQLSEVDYKESYYCCFSVIFRLYDILLIDVRL